MQEMLLAADLTSGMGDLTGAIPLVLVAIAIASLTLIIAIRFEKRLKSQRLQRVLEANSDNASSLQVQKRYSESLKIDFHPRSWLSKFSQVSVKHLIVMSLFYHAIGIGLGSAGSTLIAYLDPSYEEPILPFSLFDGLSAGPVEETFAFGIPFYASGNHYVVLAIGSLWALAHILNTDAYSITSLAYGNVLFAIPHIFLSLRTWASGKGWFAILFHSGWNSMAFGMSCAAEEIPCSVVGFAGIPFMAGSSYLLATIVTAEVLLLVTYLLYYRRSKKELALPSASPPTKVSELAIFGGSSQGATYSVESSPITHPTKAWYLLPILLGIIGGILGIVGGLIMYFKLKKRDPRMARNGLLLGIIFFIVNLAISGAALFFEPFSDFPSSYTGLPKPESQPAAIPLGDLQPVIIMTATLS